MNPDLPNKKLGLLPFLTLGLLTSTLGKFAPSGRPLRGTKTPMPRKVRLHNKKRRKIAEKSRRRNRAA